VNGDVANGKILLDIADLQYTFRLREVSWLLPHANRSDRGIDGATALHSRSRSDILNFEFYRIGCICKWVIKCFFKLMKNTACWNGSQQVSCLKKNIFATYYYAAYCIVRHSVASKALRCKFFFVKALTKQL